MCSFNFFHRCVFLCLLCLWFKRLWLKSNPQIQNKTFKRLLSFTLLGVSTTLFMLMDSCANLYPLGTNLRVVRGCMCARPVYTNLYPSQLTCHLLARESVLPVFGRRDTGSIHTLISAGGCIKSTGSPCERTLYCKKVIFKTKAVVRNNWISSF